MELKLQHGVTIQRNTQASFETKKDIYKFIEGYDIDGFIYENEHEGTGLSFVVLHLKDIEVLGKENYVVD